MNEGQKAQDRRPAAAAPAPLLSLDRVFRSYHQGGNRLDVLRGVSLTVGQGELVALVGPSGAGKSTLLHLAGLLERPDAGEVLIGGKRCDRMSDTARTELRRSTTGFVYQFHHLLPEFNALENVVLPQMIAGVPRKAALGRANELLRLVGLAARATHRPAQLSGGEQQRVAIARALANQPQILIADEPTGNLDHHTADEVFDMLARLIRSTGTGALVATHNLMLAHRMDRVLELEDGVLFQHERVE
ncbi:MAG: ABC transporter ATP-binding protein [Rhodospirillaceae bacterium]|nr:ABC transporter ATP-binding protein [Rhodospirillaceae bacterium]